MQASQLAHLPIAIHDLAIILATAGATSVLFRFLKQPVVFGYILAGILVGPNLSLVATISDIESVRTWGEIGVIFVLFGVGLEFSFKRLMSIGVASVITAGFETFVMLILGLLMGVALGWTFLDALFLGGMISISSTLIITKIFEEKRLKNQSFANLVFGVLVVEDIVAVLLLVLLSTVAVSRQFNGSELAYAAIRLGFFLTLWFAVGLFFLPGLIRKIKRYLSDETALIFSVGLCLLMVLIATTAGFSSALGAFVMGSLIAETDEGARIEKVLVPLKNLFGAVFFVSIGMLFNVQDLMSLWPTLLLALAVLVIGKSLGVFLGAILSGQDSRVAVRAGLSMTQIGEFSFIIASLGMSLGVVSSGLFSLAVSLSLVSAALTPVWMKQSEGVHQLLMRNIPKRWLNTFTQYQNLLHGFQGRGVFRLIFRAHLPRVLVNVVLILALTWGVRFVIFPLIKEPLESAQIARLIAFSLGTLICLPFYWGLCFARPSRSWYLEISGFGRVRWLEIAIFSTKLSIGFSLFILSAAQYLSWKTFSVFTIGILTGIAVIFFFFTGRIYLWFERRFLGQLKDSEKGMGDSPPLLPWDTHLTTLSVSVNSILAGLTIEKIGLNSSLGVMIAAIERGRRRIIAPRAEDQIFPGDKLLVIGGDADIERLRRLTDDFSEDFAEAESPLSLQSIVLSLKSDLVGKTVRESGLRERVNGLLVGVERQGFRQINPSPEFRFLVDDRLWIVGEPERILNLNS